MQGGCSHDCVEYPLGDNASLYLAEMTETSLTDHDRASIIWMQNIIMFIFRSNILLCMLFHENYCIHYDILISFQLVLHYSVLVVF